MLCNLDQVPWSDLKCGRVPCEPIILGHQTRKFLTGATVAHEPWILEYIMFRYMLIYLRKEIWYICEIKLVIAFSIENGRLQGRIQYLSLNPCSAHFPRLSNVKSYNFWYHTLNRITCVHLHARRSASRQRRAQPIISFDFSVDKMVSECM